MLDLTTILPLSEQAAFMTRHGEAIRERREYIGFKTATACANASVTLEREDPAAFKSFSQSSLSRWELDRTGEYIEAAHGRSLRTLAYLLEWTSTEFERHVGIPIGRVPRLEENAQNNIFNFLERYGEKADLTIRIPIYGSVAAGIKGFDETEPEDWRRFAPEELPKGIEDPAGLVLVRANGTSMYQEDMTRPVPDGSWLLVERGSIPEEGQLVVAYIPERDLGVVKQYSSDGTSVILRSYRVGGPMFWSGEYPGIKIEGVVRRVSYEP